MSHEELLLLLWLSRRDARAPYAFYIQFSNQALLSAVTLPRISSRLKRGRERMHQYHHEGIAQPLMVPSKHTLLRNPRSRLFLKPLPVMKWVSKAPTCPQIHPPPATPMRRSDMLVVGNRRYAEKERQTRMRRTLREI